MPGQQRVGNLLAALVQAQAHIQAGRRLAVEQVLPPDRQAGVAPQAAQVGIKGGFQAGLAVYGMRIAEEGAERRIGIGAGVLAGNADRFGQRLVMLVEQRPTLHKLVGQAAAGIIGAGQQVGAAPEAPPANCQPGGCQAHQQPVAQLAVGPAVRQRHLRQAVGFGAGLQQEQQRQEGGQQGGATVGNEGQRHASERQQAQVAADDQDALRGQVSRQPGCQQAPEGVWRTDGQAQAAGGQQGQHSQQA